MAISTSPIPSLRTLIERTITVADIVSDPLWVVSADEGSVDAAAALAARDFDVAGVADEPITRYVARTDLEPASGTVNGVAQPILASQTVEKSMPLAALIASLGRRPYVFVLNNDQVGWIVTRADLQAPAVGVVVLAYLVALESGLAPVVLDELGPGWFDCLPADRQAKALQVFEDKRAANAETGLEDCLYFSDWLQLAASAPALLERLGYMTKNAFAADTGSFATVRNTLAHGGTLLDGCPPDKAIDRFERIRSLTERLWEQVDALQERWDRYADTVITTASGTALTGPGAEQLRAEPVHVLTAWNPESITRSAAANRSANEQLLRALQVHGHKPVPVVGESPDGAWAEESFLVEGMTRAAAAEFGHRFGQLSVFELTNDELLVLRCTDASVMRSRGRLAPGAR